MDVLYRVNKFDISMVELMQNTRTGGCVDRIHLMHKLGIRDVTHKV
jgi:hypothetical protein